MKAFEGFKSEPRTERYPMLPVGTYVCSIQAVKEDGTYPDDSILLRLEIAEGPWKGYYTNRYHHDQERSDASESHFEVRYKGDFRIQAPRAENPHIGNLEWAVRRFNTAIWSIEDSNEGFHFDFGNVAALKGKLVGINVREGTYRGNTFTEIGRLESVKMVREGKVPPMKPREDRSAAMTANSGFTVVETDELPF